MKTTAFFAAFLMMALGCASTASADTFGSGVNTFDIDFVTIGNPGNAADPDDGSSTNPGVQNFGSVANTFQMGKFEISEDMIEKANAEGTLGITKDTRGANKPATSISWFEAAKFVNWLNTSTGSTPAYKFDGSGNFQLWQPGDTGYNPNNLYRNSLAKYFLPSVDEWYKAAYYAPSGVYFDYPTGSDTDPTPIASGTANGTAVYNGQAEPADITLAGGLSPYGTMGQGGNVWEWEETDFDLVNNSISSPSSRGVRGGDWGNVISGGLLSSDRSFVNPLDGVFILGFRVASIPEPSTLLLGALASVGLLMRRCPNQP